MSRCAAVVNRCVGLSRGMALAKCLLFVPVGADRSWQGKSVIRPDSRAFEAENTVRARILRR